MPPKPGEWPSSKLGVAHVHSFERMIAHVDGTDGASGCVVNGGRMAKALNLATHALHEVLDATLVHCLVAPLDATRMALLLLVERADLVKVPSVDVPPI